jgi:hypothetical protein
VAWERAGRDASAPAGAPLRKTEPLTVRSSSTPSLLSVLYELASDSRYCSVNSETGAWNRRRRSGATLSGKTIVCEAACCGTVRMISMLVGPWSALRNRSAVPLT